MLSNQSSNKTIRMYDFRKMQKMVKYKKWVPSITLLLVNPIIKIQRCNIFAKLKGTTLYSNTKCLEFLCTIPTKGQTILKSSQNGFLPFLLKEYIVLCPFLPLWCLSQFHPKENGKIIEQSLRYRETETPEYNGPTRVMAMDPIEVNSGSIS